MRPASFFMILREVLFLLHRPKTILPLLMRFKLPGESEQDAAARWRQAAVRAGSLLVWVDARRFACRLACLLHGSIEPLWPPCRPALRTAVCTAAQVDMRITREQALQLRPSYLHYQQQLQQLRSRTQASLDILASVRQAGAPLQACPPSSPQQPVGLSPSAGPA